MYFFKKFISGVKNQVAPQGFCKHCLFDWIKAGFLAQFETIKAMCG